MVQAVQCVQNANQLSALETLVALEFAFGSLTVPGCSRGSLLLIAQEALIRYAQKSGFTGQWSGA